MKAVQEFITITPWTIIFQICNLLILFTLIKKFLFKRVMAVLEARQQQLDGIYEAADKARDDADRMKAEYTQRMSDAREEADRLVKNAVDTATRRGEAIVQEARDEAAHMKQKAESDIEQERRKAYSELVGEISGMAVDIAGKMVEREISEDDHRGLVEEFIRNAGETQ
ncbi:MAG: F0F1 ATP synthase subunit B [Clostridia bacterium]|nr:F0F1 ATP synthase subunit B [Clostridia bacterium]